MQPDGSSYPLASRRYWLRSTTRAAERTKPRVLFVSPVSDAKGGSEFSLIEMMNNPGIEPILVTPERGELTAAATRLGIPFVCFHPAGLMGVHRPLRLKNAIAAALDAVRCARRVERIAREHQCDLVHLNGLKVHAVGAIMSVLFRTRVLMHLHDIPYTRLERLVWRMLGVPAWRVITISPLCWPGKIGGKVYVLPSSVYPVRAALAQAKLPDELRLGFVGRYHRHKGLDLLLDWIKAARAAGINASAVLRGRPDDAEPAYWDRIRNRIEAENLTPYVTDQGWRETSELYDDLDFLLVTSDFPDPTPRVIPEAMTAGVVVIGYPAGGIPIQIPPGTGSLARTPEEFTEALRSYISNPTLYQDTRKAAFAHGCAVREPQALAQRFAAICGAAIPGLKQLVTNEL